ncbi:alpha/beta hydrolase [Paraburkholderia sp. D15]|uniref:alpha/beta fold hydrolase n=1 Tax=Paraburkholderia sp. D15 TaxID=2880218 RepID=UPI00247A19EE|nr:alpha/beta hydrolase [Paraburkholderia sp. D15]WGS49129.1 alpha/beta hydrolase [Paraburkholderia sp. D15]
MSPKRLFCAAAVSLYCTGLCLIDAGAAFAQTPAPADTPMTTPSAEPADGPGAQGTPSDAPAPPPIAQPAQPAQPAQAPQPAAPTQAAANAAPMTGPVRNVVLVHGAFVDGSSWNGVIAKLQQKGYHVSSVQNPLTSLADDVAATRRVLARQNGPTMLVGHSWGGVVITEAGANAPNVAGLVYVAAIAPDLHESTQDLMKRAAPMPAAQAIMPDANGFLWLDRSKYRAEFAADVPENLTRVLATAQVPIAAKAFGETVSQVAWREKPSWYVLTTKDRAVSPDVEKFMADRMGAKIVPVASSHLAPVSHAGAIADAIDRAARELSRQQ